MKLVKKNVKFFISANGYINIIQQQKQSNIINFVTEEVLEHTSVVGSLHRIVHDI